MNIDFISRKAETENKYKKHYYSMKVRSVCSVFERCYTVGPSDNVYAFF